MNCLKSVKSIYAYFLLVALIASCAPAHKMLDQQLGSNYKGSVTSMQGYVIKNEDEGKKLQELWQNVANKMKEKPGFLGAKLSKGLDNSSTAASLAKRNLWLGWNKRKEHE